MKLFYLDLETTGTCHWLHCIHQIAGIIEIDGVEMERFMWNVAPHPAARIEAEALAVSGLVPEDLKGFAYFEQRAVHQEITKLLSKYVDKFNSSDKFHVVAYNGASFDMAFFRAFFIQCGDKYFGSWFWSCCLDVMVLAGQYLIAERSGMENFQQKTVAKQFGIAIDESRLHDAVYDVEVMIQIYKYMYPI